MRHRGARGYNRFAVLNLASKTDPRWVETALSDLDELLLDHAHCERKAAGMALRLMFRYPDQPFLHDTLSRLAREELAHYEEVLRAMAARGGSMRRQRPSPYAGRLYHCVRSAEPERLLDTLLACAIIEARSCERFQLLADAVDDPKLSALYNGLLASEARHHGCYLELAVQASDGDSARARLRELAEREAEIIADPTPMVRMHS
ncbi:MAG: tRNA-(ms[2]io[6]A)-hydroxylase [Deltaproteobacteria bacterium]|nr:tRNA-(ms[2]io[6]A)-hydroxylase [Deltaproteobacteria bacterium]